MGIDQLNRWHWMAIGTLLGTLLAYVWTLTADSIEGLQSSTTLDFERDVIFEDQRSHQPLITGIVIHPMEYSRAAGANANFVTYKRLVSDGKGNYGWKPKFFVAKSPFVPSVNRNIGFDAATTIRTYLSDLASQYRFIDFRYGWWLVPVNATIAGAISGGVIMGGIWPILLNILFGAGLGTQSDTSASVQAAFSLWRYKPRPRRPAIKSNRRRTADDIRRTQHVADAYERGLAATATSSTSDQAAKSDAKPPTPVKTLNAEAENPTQMVSDSDEIELKNKEYYPVVVHHQKHEDSKESDERAK